MGALAKKIGQKKEVKTKKETKQKAEEVVATELTEEKELLSTLDEIKNIEEQIAEAEAKIREIITPLRAQYKVDELHLLLEKKTEVKEKLVPTIISGIKKGIKSIFSVKEKAGRKTPKYKDLCEKFIPNLSSLKEDKAWYTQKVEDVLTLNGEEV